MELILKSKFRKIRFLQVFIIFLVLAGCTTNSNQTELFVSAASSLQESLTEIANIYMSENPTVNINLNFAGSNVLQRQIQEGFEVDVFLSAHKTPYLELRNVGLVAPGEIFARNELVLVSSSERVQYFYDIANKGVSLIFANESVPIGIYTAEVINAVDQNHAGFKYAVINNVITRGENVRQVLLQVSLGEGEAAFVYRTDAIASDSDNLTVIELPEQYQIINEFYLALVTRGEIKEEARDFFEFVLSTTGQEVLQSHGFK